MAQQMIFLGKQMRVGAREGFAYHSVKLVLLANGNRCEVDSNMFFLSGKALYPFKVLPCPNSDLSLHTVVSIVCGWKWWQKTAVAGVIERTTSQASKTGQRAPCPFLAAYFPTLHIHSHTKESNRCRSPGAGGVLCEKSWLSPPLDKGWSAKQEKVMSRTKGQSDYPCNETEMEPASMLVK
jgi:hypothetical protein